MKEDTINKSNEFCKKFEDEGLLKGNKFNGKIAVAILLASKATGHPKDIKKILDATMCSQRDLNSCYKKVKIVINIPRKKVQNLKSQYAEKACNILQVPMDVNNAA